MNRLLITLICGGALLLCPLHSRAEPYELIYGIVGTNQKKLSGSKSIKRPLVVDLVDHTLTLPSLVTGYTLTLESEDGDIYTFIITGTTFEIPLELSGNIKVMISDGISYYQGVLKMCNYY